MDKLSDVIFAIENCATCGGDGVLTWALGDEYDFEWCECNPHELLLDGRNVIWDGGTLFTTAEAL